MTRRSKRIIVEGMDGSGKTVLINHLLFNFPKLEPIVNTLNDKQNFDEWWPQVLDEEEDETIPIHDRFFYSELVYGPILRGHINATPALVQNALWYLRSSALLIYARPHTDMLRAGIKTNQQMEGVTDKFMELLGLYDQLMEAEKAWYTNRFIHYVWHRDNELGRVRELIRGYLAGELG